MRCRLREEETSELQTSPEWCAETKRCVMAAYWGT